MEALKGKYPDFKRSFIRKLSQMTEIAFEIWEEASSGEGRQMVLEAFNVGMFLRSVRIAGGRIEKLVIGLKNYGKQTGDIWVTVDLREGIGDTLTVLNNRLKRYEVSLDLKELPQISCNVGEMNQVWTNLLVNAMDATEEGRKIWVSCDKIDGYIEVRIQDSGSGIDEDKLQTIFKPNYTTKNTSGSFGLGLGLSISDEIARKHGGKIIAGNRPEGGTVFRVRLPC
ncbi:MAG: HAMP domain-containing sensor histidine kinase [Verrucomicrobiota bacterium]